MLDWVGKLSSMVGVQEFLQNGFFGVVFLRDIGDLKRRELGDVDFVMNNLSGGFLRVGAPRITINYQEIRQVNRLTPIYVPQNVELGSITLGKGLTFIGSNLYKWIEKYMNFEYEPLDVVIIHFHSTILADLGQKPLYLPSRLIILYDAQPVSYGFDDLDALSGEVTIEEIELNFSLIKQIDAMNLR